jgi:hypothetical protein
MHSVWHNSFIHLAVCLTTCPKPLPKRTLHIVRFRAFSLRCEYPLLSLRSSSSVLRLSPRLPVTSIPPFIFPSITCCRSQFLHKMWPIQLAFRLLISCRIFLCSLTMSNTSSFLTWSVQLISILLQQLYIYIYNYSTIGYKFRPQKTIIRPKFTKNVKMPVHIVQKHPFYGTSLILISSLYNYYRLLDVPSVVSCVDIL